MKKDVAITRDNFEIEFTGNGKELVEGTLNTNATTFVIEAVKFNDAAFAQNKDAVYTIDWGCDSETTTDKDACGNSFTSDGRRATITTNDGWTHLKLHITVTNGSGVESREYNYTFVISTSPAQLVRVDNVSGNNEFYVGDTIVIKATFNNTIDKNTTNYDNLSINVRGLYNNVYEFTSCKINENGDREIHFCHTIDGNASSDQNLKIISFNGFVGNVYNIYGNGYVPSGETSTINANSLNNIKIDASSGNIIGIDFSVGTGTKVNNVYYLNKDSIKGRIIKVTITLSDDVTSFPSVLYLTNGVSASCSINSSNKYRVMCGATVGTEYNAFNGEIKITKFGDNTVSNVVVFEQANNLVLDNDYVNDTIYMEGMDKISHNRLKLDVIQKFPLFLSELSVIIGLTLLVAFGTGDIKMLIGVFAVAAFRLLPAMRGILSGWTQIQNVSSYLEVIEEGLMDDDSEWISESNENLSFDKDISIEHLTYAYPDSSNVLDNFECNISKGEYVGFRGSSGVGKSTLFNSLIGLLKPSKGRILIDGAPLSVENRKSWMQHIGYVPQDVFIFNGTLAENIALGCQSIDKERIKDILNNG